MGGGEKVLIAFHGYGNNAEWSQAFEAIIGREYTIFSIDLPHHGDSKWEKDKILKINELNDLIKAILKEQNIEKVSLLGYSLGGRVCLCAIEQLPEMIDRVLLLAPDGLVFNSLYYFVTRNYIGKKLFRSFLKHADRYLPLVKWAKERKLIDAAKYKFVMQYLENDESRKFLQQVWPGTSELVPNHKRLNTLIRLHEIPIDIFMGRHDKIIKPEYAERFKGNVSTVRVHVVNKGHKVLDGDTIGLMARCLLD